MAVASHSTTIKVHGTSTTFTNEATTKVTANTVYQITDTSKRILDPSEALVVEVDADGGGAGGYVTADPEDYTVDYLFGKVIFGSDQGSSALVRITGAYLSVTAVAECTDYSISLSREVLDSSNFDSGGYRAKIAGLSDVSGNLKVLKLLTYNGGGAVLDDLYTTGAPVLLEVRPGGAGDYFRAWIILESTENAGAVDGLHEATVNFVGAAQAGNGEEGEFAAWGWGT